MGQDLAGVGDGHGRIVGYDRRFGSRGREKFRVADCDYTVKAGSGRFGPLG